MANGHGGARLGAGRKSKAEKYETEIQSAEGRWAGLLPSVQTTVEQLATGGLKRITRKKLPAGLVTTKKVLLNSLGEPYSLDVAGNPKAVEVPAYPDMDPKKLVVVEEVVETLLPDRAACIYIIDRILGKPTATLEADVKTDLGDAFLDAFGGALNKIYGHTETNGGSETGAAESG